MKMIAFHYKVDWKKNGVSTTKMQQHFMTRKKNIMTHNEVLHNATLERTTMSSTLR